MVADIPEPGVPAVLEKMKFFGEPSSFATSSLALVVDSGTAGAVQIGQYLRKRLSLEARLVALCTSMRISTALR